MQRKKLTRDYGYYSIQNLMQIENYHIEANASFVALLNITHTNKSSKSGNRYKKTSLATYLGMGFTSLGMLGELYEKLPEQAIGLLALGGLIYTLGVFFYVKKTVPYTHAIWHLFVLGGVTCHFLMIYWYV